MPNHIGGGGEDRTPDLGVMNPKIATFTAFHPVKDNPLKSLY